MKRETIIELTLSVALLILLVTAALPIFNVQWAPARYIFAAGAVMALVARLFETYHGKNMRLNRLNRMGKVSALLYCVSAAFLVFNFSGTSGRDWIAFLLAGAVMQLYASLATQYEVSREAKIEASKNADKK